ncbi:hypothetical protein BEN71_13985 [Acinetobacter wuhouensis]|uniref:hypothetical protein n=1 Tax=Acinetobacter wuhouensis TaxID=1879050 RepID=UPI00083A5985|nr:hypothetical protein [Acinetobacter wuhouensis]AXQ23117.1 hypothetical protein BEN71_13985 [Acinetobacter wuhouensis]
MRALLFISLIFPCTALASFVNSCNLEVQLLEDASSQTIYFNRNGLEQEQTQPAIIHGTVLNVKAAGRADQGCDHYIGKIIQKALNSNQRIRLNKDQVVKINILIKDDANLPFSETVTYLKDPE